jgi:hypothetical protein
MLAALPRLTITDTLGTVVRSGDDRSCAKLTNPLDAWVNQLVSAALAKNYHTIGWFYRHR